MKILDLTHQIFNSIPTYPSDPEVEIVEEKNICAHNTLLHSIKMGTHTGTHLDVEAHVRKNGKVLNDYPLSSFMGTTIKVDRSTYKSLSKINKNISGVIFETGWHKFYNNSEKYFSKDRPLIPSDIFNYIKETKIKFFGCDLPSIDKSGDKKTFA